MQKVAGPTITVKRLSGTSSTWVKVLLIATPVTIPGRAVGRITRKEIVARPKKRWRATASAARVMSASRGASSLNACENQGVVNPGGGHSRILRELKA